MGTRGRGTVGIVGLGAMGANLALQAAGAGFEVAAHDPWPEACAAWDTRAGVPTRATPALRDFVARLPRPRRILVLLKAGEPVDRFLEAAAPLLDVGDVLVDLGNSHFRDTERRQQQLAPQGLHLLGVGISGGSEGARTGASFMGGGSREAWSTVAPVLTALAARADGVPCSRWMGPGGAGHFVKMVHNAIEYVEMQALSEAYLVLRAHAGHDPSAIADSFDAWNRGIGASFLTGLAARVLRVRDPDGTPLVDRIRDEVGQKGTGRWAVESALELGYPAPSLAQAVFARALSASAEKRGLVLPGPRTQGGRPALVGPLGDALLATRVVAFGEGLGLLAAASHAFDWELDLPAVAEVWRAGCILRGALLEPIAVALRREPQPVDLLAAPELATELEQVQDGWRQVVAEMASAGIPVPAFAGALAAYDGLRTPRLGAALIAAQRDAFGAHGFRRTDRPGWFHADWDPA